ncbi:MAG: DegT/DnrJ/EryC1/StrS family aminotransferase [Planctomycetaceae bacterium]
MERIPVAGPSISSLEIEYVTRAVSECWYGNANACNERFETAFAHYIGRRFAVSLPSCTSAIHLSLAALGIGPGDEVIVPDVTWIASAAPISYVGATTVFADIDPATWCLSAESLEACITERTRAVIVVELYGNMPRMSEIVEVARRHGIAVIEDAAEAFGSSFQTQKAGSFGDTGVFSFHGSKTMTTGEGGMFVTDRQDLFDRVCVLRDHGRRPGDVTFFNSEVAYKYKMSSLQAALGLAQLERADELVAKKKQIYQWYSEALADNPMVALNPVRPDVDACFWMTTAVFDPPCGLTTATVQSELAAVGIDSRPFFHPLSSLPAFADAHDMARARFTNHVAYDISSRGVNLPSHLNLTRDDVVRVAREVEEITRRQRPVRLRTSA